MKRYKRLGSCGTEEEQKDKNIKQIKHTQKKFKNYDPLQHHRNLSPTSWTLEEKRAERKVKKVHATIKQKQQWKRYRKKHKRKRAKQWKAWAAKHKDVVRAIAAKRKQIHGEEIKQYHKKYKLDNPKKVKQHNRTYYLNHKERLCKKSKEYRKEHGAENRNPTIDKI